MCPPPAISSVDPPILTACSVPLVLPPSESSNTTTPSTAGSGGTSSPRARFHHHTTFEAFGTVPTTIHLTRPTSLITQLSFRLPTPCLFHHLILDFSLPPSSPVPTICVSDPPNKNPTESLGIHSLYLSEDLNLDEVSDLVVELPPSSPVDPTSSTALLDPKTAGYVHQNNAAPSKESRPRGRRRASSMAGSKSPLRTPPPPPSMSLSLEHLSLANASNSPSIDDSNRFHSVPSPSISLAAKISVFEQGNPQPIRIVSPLFSLDSLNSYASSVPLTWTVVGKGDQLDIEIHTDSSTFSPIVTSIQLSGYPIALTPDGRQVLNLINLAHSLQILDASSATDCTILGAIASLKSNKVRQYVDLMRAAARAHVPSMGAPVSKQQAVYHAHIGATIAAHANLQGPMAKEASNALDMALRLWTMDSDLRILLPPGNPLKASNTSEGNAMPESMGKEQSPSSPQDIGWILANHLNVWHDIASALLASNIEYYVAAGLDLIVIVLDTCLLATPMHLSCWIQLIIYTYNNLLETAVNITASACCAADQLIQRARLAMDQVYDAIEILDVSVVTHEILVGAIVPLLEHGNHWDPSALLLVHRMLYRVIALHPCLVWNLPPATMEVVLSGVFRDSCS